MIARGGYIFMVLVFLSEFAFAEVSVFENENFTFGITPYLQTDVISIKNTVDLDSGNKDDRSTYFGVDYSLGMRLSIKEEGPQFFVKLERNGPYDYDAPLFIHNTLTVAGPGRIEAYRNDELLPQLEEYWFDLPIKSGYLRFKAGLFPFEIGKGYAFGTGSYENYGISVYHPGENFNWRLHYFRPDLVYKNHLGPRIRQEEDEAIDYEPNAANYFTCDATLNFSPHKMQPFIGVLVDYTSEGKRTNLFANPVHKEILGTFGFDYDFKVNNFSFGFEAARNFGRAESTSKEFKDVEHKGYLLYTNVSYSLGKFIPHAQFLLSSGNRVTTEMVDNGDVFFPGSANKAFSVYSPLNTNLSDSLGPSADSLPLVFFGWGYGLSYGPGVYRPSTTSDCAVLDNMIMPSVGFDYNFTEKLKVTLDYWYLLANEKGVGTLGGSAKELSRKLGQEVDFTVSYSLSRAINISLYTGLFFPGRYFKEERDDTGGSLLTPFVRGDGNANSAYQIELVTTFEF